MMFTCASLKCARYQYHLYDLSQKKVVGSCFRLCCICGSICRPAGYCLNTSTALQMSALLTFLCQRKERQSCQLNAMLQCNLTESRVELLPPQKSNIKRPLQLYNERSIIIIIRHERYVTGAFFLPQATMEDLQNMITGCQKQNGKLLINKPFIIFEYKSICIWLKCFITQKLNSILSPRAGLNANSCSMKSILQLKTIKIS